MENVRYEILFGINNRGPQFRKGIFSGTSTAETVDDFVDEITKVLVKEFDNRIGMIEQKVNTTFAMKWLVNNGANAENKTCLSNGPFATTCEDASLGDFSLPECEACDTRREIDTWHRRITSATSTHVDPRIKAENFDWAYFGNKLVCIFKKLKNRVVASSIDWKKMAHLVRAYLMFILSLKMTEKLLLKADAAYFAGLNITVDFMTRNRTDRSNNVACYECIDTLVHDLLKHYTENMDHDDVESYEKMTVMEGYVFRRNEREDNRFPGNDYEKDEYISIEYTKNTADIGKVYGRVLAGRKRIVFNPLRSSFIDNLIYDATDADHQKLRDMGITVGPLLTLPTRALRSETRQFLWDELEYWPPCTEKESKVNKYEIRYKCSTPTPMHVINIADAVSQLEQMRSPIELL